MTTKPFSITAFNAQFPAFKDKLLSSLPEGEEQVVTKGYVRQLQKDADDVWRRSMKPVRAAQAYLDWVRAECSLHGDRTDLVEKERVAFDAYVELIDMQMAVPALTKDALKWKHSHLPVGAGYGRTARRKALIADDEARMGAWANV